MKDSKDKNKVKGGLADNMSIQDIAKKHKVSVTVINSAINKGVKVEMEHTSDKNVAYEIAKDHVFEDPKYYDKLKMVEGNKINESFEEYSNDALTDMIVNLSRYEGNEESIQSVRNELKKRKGVSENLKEDVDLKIIDQAPDTITIVVKYNNRNAGIIMIAPSPTKEDTIEIVGIKFKKDYEEMHIISDAVKTLWSLFTDKQSIIVSPKLEAVQFWNSLGFQRISPNYLISNRGH